MNKTLNINLAGFIFHIDENAFQRLERYLNTLKRQFSVMEGGSEIISDIELRIAELFRERTTDSKEVITEEDVQEVIGIMGKPEDYLDQDEEALPPEEPVNTGKKRRIFRDPDNRILGGVSAGLAAYFGIDSLWLRLLFVILTFTGPGVIIYIVMWIVIPKATTTAEKLQMRGEEVNISSIQRSIRDEMKNVEDSARSFSHKAANYDYRNTGNQLSRFFGDLGKFLVDALRMIFKFIVVLIGIFFLFLGFVVLFAVLGALFAGGTQIFGTEYNIIHGFEFLQMITENEAHFNMLLAGVILTVVAPLFLLIYFGIRILFKLEPLNRPTKSALALTTFVGLVLLLISGIRIGLQMDAHSSITRDVALVPAKNYYLTGVNDSVSEAFREDYDSHWRNYGELNAFNLVDVDIRQTDREQAYLEVIVDSEGSTHREARYFANQLAYDVIINDSVIEIPLYYLLGNEDKFRDQEVYIVMYLPVGSSVYIEDNLAEYLDDVKNLQHTWDWEMTGQYWDMTERGLSCRGCEIPQPDGNELRKEFDLEKDSIYVENDSVLIFDKEGKLKLKIFEGEIDLEIESEDSSAKVRISAIKADAHRSKDSLGILDKNYDILI